MVASSATHSVSGRLAAFETAHAAAICAWARTDEEVYRLAPSTPPPLTEEKVLEWQRPDGRSFIYRLTENGPPAAYGEVNPMIGQARHLWLGHCVVDPSHRRCGIGTEFIRALLHVAFGELNAERVSLIVFPENEPAIRCYEKAGFRYAADEFHGFSIGAQVRLLRLEALPAAD